MKEQNCYKLFIDELGTANPASMTSDEYIISGCSVNQASQKWIQERADQIKFKYWGRTDIIFHSREIGRRQGDFTILKDKGVRDSFFQDFEDWLLESSFRSLFVVLDKIKVRKRGWGHTKVLKEASHAIIRNFLLILLSGNSRGEVIVESAAAEIDFHYHKELGFFLSQGISKLRVSHEKIKETITTISFVTKRNYDIEEQIADIMAYAAQCKLKKIKPTKGSYEEMILRVLRKKIFKKPRKSSAGKEKFYSEVDSFLMLP